MSVEKIPLLENGVLPLCCVACSARIDLTKECDDLRFNKLKTNGHSRSKRPWNCPLLQKEQREANTLQLTTQLRGILRRT